MHGKAATHYSQQPCHHDRHDDDHHDLVAAALRARRHADVGVILAVPGTLGTCHLRCKRHPRQELCQHRSLDRIDRLHVLLAPRCHSGTPNAKPIVELLDLPSCHRLRATAALVVLALGFVQLHTLRIAEVLQVELLYLQLANLAFASAKAHDLSRRRIHHQMDRQRFTKNCAIDAAPRLPVASPVRVGPHQHAMDTKDMTWLDVHLKPRGPVTMLQDGQTGNISSLLYTLFQQVYMIFMATSTSII